MDLGQHSNAHRPCCMNRAIQQAASQNRNYLLFQVNNGKKKSKLYRLGCQKCVKRPKKSHFYNSNFILLKVTLIIEKTENNRSSLRSELNLWNLGMFIPFWRQYLELHQLRW